MKRLTAFHLTYGIILAIATLLYIAAEFLLAARTSNPILGTFTYLFAIVVPITILTIALKQRIFLTGALTFLQSVKSGFLISLISGTITGIGTALIVYFSPTLISDYFTFVVVKMQEAGESQQAIDNAVSNLTNLYTPSTQGVMMFISSITGGTAISAIIGLILRRKKMKPTKA